MRKLREAAGLTQQEVADSLGIDRCTYWKMENGETRMVNEHTEDLAKILNAHPVSVLGYDDNAADGSFSDYSAATEKKCARLNEELTILKREVEELREKLKATVGELKEAKGELEEARKDKVLYRELYEKELRGKEAGGR